MGCPSGSCVVPVWMAVPASKRHGLKPERMTCRPHAGGAEGCSPAGGFDWAWVCSGRQATCKKGTGRLETSS